MTKLPIGANYNLETDKYYKFVSFMGVVQFVKILDNRNKCNQIYRYNQLVVQPLQNGGASISGAGIMVASVDSVSDIFELDNDDVLKYIVAEII